MKAMNKHQKTNSHQTGLSLIELMIAMVIGLLIVLGMIQIFLGSKQAYYVQEGLSRVQENSRFSLQYFERNVRMAGFMGCGSDLQRVPPNDPTSPNYPYDTRFINHLVPSTLPTPTEAPAKFRFQRPIEGFHYTGASVDTQAPAVGALTDWTPNLPSELTGQNVVKGTDVLILRFFGEASTPVISTFLTDGTFTVADPGFVKKGGYYGIENCGATPTYGFSEIFTATTVNPTTGVIQAIYNGTSNNSGITNVLKVPGTLPALTWSHGIGFSMPTGSPLNASVHEAQYLAIFIKLRTNNDGTTSPVLAVQHFVTSGAKAGDLVVDELADNVENLRFQFGMDTSNPRDDTVDIFKTADQLVAGIATPQLLDAEWAKVISVRVGVLVRSPDSNNGVTAPASYSVAGSPVKPKSDSRVRQVYETTIALRNRIFNS